MSECPRCGSSRVESRRESDGHDYAYDHSCAGCSHSWWEPGGMTLGHALSHADDEPHPPAPFEWTEIGAAFAIAAPVTCEDFERFCEHSHRRFSWYRRTRGTAVRVSFDDAAEYAAWRGARLPTASECERAGSLPDAEWSGDGATASGEPAPRFDVDAAAFRLVRVDTAPALHVDTTGDELLEAVVAEPRSDAARSVYADHLQQRGDPRGELIALQLVRAASAGPVTLRERELWSTHRDEWLGAVASVGCPSTLRFERGFLRGCRVLASAVAPRRDRTWWTVEELECDDAALLADPCMRSLRRVAATPATLYQLAAGARTLAIDAIVGHMRTGCDGLARPGIELDHDAAAWAAIAKLDGLAGVRAIALHTAYTAGDHIVRKLLATPLGERVERIAITGSTALESWLPLLRGPSALQRVAIRLDPATPGVGRAIVAAERVDGTIVVRCELGRSGGPPPAVATILAGLAAAGATRLVIDAPDADPDQLLLAGGFATVETTRGRPTLLE